MIPSGLKPCLIGIVLATGIYMVLGNCFGTVSAIKANTQAIIITALLVASMYGYKHFAKKTVTGPFDYNIRSSGCAGVWRVDRLNTV